MIPVTLITGFLGAGKTTAIQRLLQRKPASEQWAVIINEFGKISIDAQTLGGNGSEQEIFDISGGCICCTSRLYLEDTVRKIINRPEPCQRIIIEPSGLGGVDMIATVVNQYQDLALKPIICIVDCGGLENPRLQKNLLYRSQIASSPVIVWSKHDLITDSFGWHLSMDQFKISFPQKTYYSGIEEAFEHQDQLYELRLQQPVEAFPQDHTESYEEISISFPAHHIIDTVALKNLFESYPSIIRAKGFSLSPQGWVLFNYTLSGMVITSCEGKELSQVMLACIRDESNSVEDIRQQIHRFLA